MIVHAVVALLVKKPVLDLLRQLLPVFWLFNLSLPLARNLHGICRVFRRASALVLFRLGHIPGARVARFRRAGKPRGRQHPSVLDDSTISSLLSVAI
ncbi:unnamed protein product [Spirodela intermedia]|uniref:Uncharacterized protein n=1 Tax=Spirodela intermedia TaxID=51605 RepID=A0A7I8IUY3_SPIIN|nr:unnamed protein product [Spirodela intermedia]CAA6661432.1 unnamed protein product [Spirodela intermedia]